MQFVRARRAAPRAAAPYMRSRCEFVPSCYSSWLSRAHASYRWMDSLRDVRATAGTMRNMAHLVTTADKKICTALAIATLSGASPQLGVWVQIGKFLISWISLIVAGVGALVGAAIASFVWARRARPPRPAPPPP